MADSNNNKSLPQFLGFSIVGASNTVVSYVSFLVFSAMGIHYVVANALSFVCGSINSYIWNSKYVFPSEERTRADQIRTFVKSLIAGVLACVVIGGASLSVIIDFLHVPVAIAPILNTCITFPLNYLLCRLWAYRS